VDVHVQQAFDNPTLFMEINRASAQSMGCSRVTFAQNVLVSLSSSFQTSPAFWLDPKNGVEYSVAVQSRSIEWIPTKHSQNTPINGSSPGAAPQILGNLVQMRTTARPAEISHYTTQP